MTMLMSIQYIQESVIYKCPELGARYVTLSGLHSRKLLREEFLAILLLACWRFATESDNRFLLSHKPHFFSSTANIVPVQPKTGIVLGGGKGYLLPYKQTSWEEVSCKKQGVDILQSQVCIKGEMGFELVGTAVEALKCCYAHFCLFGGLCECSCVQAYRNSCFQTLVRIFT